MHYVGTLPKGWIGIILQHLRHLYKQQRPALSANTLGDLWNAHQVVDVENDFRDIISAEPLIVDIIIDFIIVIIMTIINNILLCQ